jgi:hypothetical protein
MAAASRIAIVDNRDAPHCHCTGSVRSCPFLGRLGDPPALWRAAACCTATCLLHCRAVSLALLHPVQRNDHSCATTRIVIICERIVIIINSAATNNRRPSTSRVRMGPTCVQCCSTHTLHMLLESTPTDLQPDRGTHRYSQVSTRSATCERCSVCSDDRCSLAHLQPSACIRRNSQRTTGTHRVLTRYSRVLTGSPWYLRVLVHTHRYSTALQSNGDLRPLNNWHAVMRLVCRQSALTGQASAKGKCAAVSKHVVVACCKIPWCAFC